MNFIENKGFRFWMPGFFLVVVALISYQFIRAQVPVSDFTNQVFDTTWKNLFQYTTFFDSVNTTNAGFTISLDGAGTLINGGTGISATTDAISGHSVEILKQPTLFGLATFSQRSNFRSGFALNSVQSETAYILTGSLHGDYYGFKIVGGTLYGVSSDGTHENAVSLESVTASTPYNLEARYLPDQSVTFYASAPGVTIRQVGISSVNLPRSTANTNSVVNNTLLDIKLTTNEAATKNLQVSFFEYLQTRNVLP